MAAESNTLLLLLMVMLKQRRARAAAEESRVAAARSSGGVAVLGQPPAYPTFGLLPSAIGQRPAVMLLTLDSHGLTEQLAKLLAMPEPASALLHAGTPEPDEQIAIVIEQAPASETPLEALVEEVQEIVAELSTPVQSETTTPVRRARRSRKSPKD